MNCLVTQIYIHLQAGSTNELPLQDNLCSIFLLPIERLWITDPNFSCSTVCHVPGLYIMDVYG